MEATTPTDVPDLPPPRMGPAPAPRRPFGPWEWLWRGQALREARSVVSDPTLAERNYLQRARVAAELADRALDPVDPLRSGSSLPLALSLYREAAYWGLLANGVKPGSAGLAHAFAAAGDDLLLYAAGGKDELAAARSALVDKGFVDTAEDHPADVQRDAHAAQAFVRALLRRAAGPEERVGELLVQRWFRTSMTVLALIAVALVGGLELARRLEEPDLAAGKPWRASSKLADCNPRERMCAGTRTSILFHTIDEKEPWFEIDLQTAQRFSVVEVVNRQDCCPDRALPLVIEVSNDAKTWKEVARRTEPFSKFKAEFKPVTARYVRTRIPRQGILHLERVSVRAR